MVVIAINLICNSFNASIVLGSQFIYSLSIWLSSIPGMWKAWEKSYYLHSSLEFAKSWPLHIFFDQQGNPER